MKNTPKFLEISQLLALVRGYRDFNVTNYLDKKISLINSTFQSEGLDSVVIGVSGGIDSALTLSILSKASQQENSPIKKIIALSLPVNHCAGTTDQDNASRKAKLVYDSLSNDKIEFLNIDLSRAMHALLVASSNEYTGNAWSDGQLVSILRTPVFYHHAALLQVRGFKSVVVGTTNRDEGAYIGFFGKASDGMVDFQIIGDLHKSEVYSLSHYLKIPQEIIDATPKGDVWDGRNDEQMIGCPYWFLEMYQLVMCYGYKDLVNHLIPSDMETYSKYSQAIEKIRATNLHKYKAGSQARFLDVIDRVVFEKRKNEFTRF